MQLALTEDQELIAKTAGDFMREKSPVSRMRALRDDSSGPAYSREIWKEMAELGWIGIPFSEELGGAGLGLAELALILEAGGRRLAPEPFISCVLLSGRALALGGTDAQKEKWVGGIANGERLVSLAYQEKGSRYDVFRHATRAASSGDGWQLSGEKVQVLDASEADVLLVAARTSGEAGDVDGVTLFLVDPASSGLTITPQTRLDSRGAAMVVLDDVEVGADSVVGKVGSGGRLLEQAVDYATVGLCAEMLGGMSEAFDLTLAYMKEREQFDQKIGAFQALAHRAAKVFIEIELSRSAVMAAARAVDAQTADAQGLVSLAKARCSDAYMLAGNEGVQIFGGVGMTDEYDIGLYLKRARSAELTFGDSRWHRDRWARLASF